MQFDGLSRRRHILRVDGDVSAGDAVRLRGPQLLEGYAAIGGVPSLRLCDYYEDTDIPLGADVFDGSPNPPQRVGSVIGVLDEAGNELERIRYDAFGRPTYEASDLAPPVISSVTRQADQSLVVAFTEQVLPPPSAGGETELISTLEPLADALW